MKRISILLVLVLALLAACGPAATIAPSGATTAPAAGSNKLEIFSWWTTGGEAAGLAGLFDLYKKQNPNVEIVNAAVAGCVVLRWRQALAGTATAAALVAATLVFGAVRLGEAPGPAAARVAIIQPSIEQPLKWEARHTRETLGIYFALLRRVAAQRPELIVWPETSFPGAWREAADVPPESLTQEWRDNLDDSRKLAKDVSKQWPTNVLLGMDAAVLQPGGAGCTIHESIPQPLGAETLRPCAGTAQRKLRCATPQGDRFLGTTGFPDTVLSCNDLLTRRQIGKHTSPDRGCQGCAHGGFLAMPRKPER